MSVKIAPSILSADFAELGAGVEAIATADYVPVSYTHLRAHETL